MDTQTTSNPSQSQHLAKMEHQRTYASNQAAIAALELATALSTVLARRFGQEFADEMCAELRHRATALQVNDITSRCTANIVAKLAEWPVWKPTH